MASEIEKGIKLNYEEREWLTQHGGRTEFDVNVDDEGYKYVFMTDGYCEDMRVYLPIFKKEKIL